MRFRRLKTDTRYMIAQELLAAAESSEGIALSPRQCLNLVAILSDADARAARLYLEAAVRQAGGAIHLDTRHIIEATGDDWTYEPDRGAGHGGLVKLASEEVAVESIR